MTLHANAQMVILDKNATNVKIRARQIHVNRVVNADVRDMISNVIVHQIVKENIVIWNEAIRAAAHHVKMVAHAERLKMDHRSSVFAVLDIVVINVKPLLILVAQIHVYMVGFVSVLNQDINVVVLMVAMDGIVKELHSDFKNYHT